MAASSKTNEELIIPRKNDYTRNHKTRNEGIVVNNSSDRCTGWIEPNSKMIHMPSIVPTRKVPVLYYLSRNGHLEHPHLIEVPLSSPHGLYLRDVMSTLNYHRGKGMANMYSWSYKRSYRNGYVWHDASDDDIIQPTNSHDYILKGSEFLQTHSSHNQLAMYNTSDTCSSTTMAPAEGMAIRRNQSWSSFDNPQEYVVVKCESNRELAAKFALNVAPRKDDQGHQGNYVTMELSTEEIPSPPPSNSSSEVLIQAVSGLRNVDRTVEDRHGTSGRMKASQVLMQLITCGFDSVRNVNDPLKSKQDQGCMVSHRNLTSKTHK